MAEGGRRAGAPGGPSLPLTGVPQIDNLPVLPSHCSLLGAERGEHNLNRRTKSVPSHQAKPWSLHVSSNPGPRSDPLASSPPVRPPDSRTKGPRPKPREPLHYKSHQAPRVRNRPVYAPRGGATWGLYAPLAPSSVSTWKR